jgi:uncharacterized membrane protein
MAEPIDRGPITDDKSQQIIFRAVLQPHRSLPPRGFTVLMIVMGGVSLVIGTAFLLQGAWPIFGYFGLDVALLYLAFRASYKSGRMFELVELSPDILTVRRHYPQKSALTWTFQPHWLRVQIADPPSHDSQLTLSSHGRHLVVGAFLSPEERFDFAQALKRALARLRGGPC